MLAAQMAAILERSPVLRDHRQTNTASRPIMIDDLAGLVREGYSCPSKEVVEEMLSFVVKPDGKAEAEEDCFDDRVIASAIAVQVHKTSGIGRFFPFLNKQQRSPEEPKQGIQPPS